MESAVNSGWRVGQQAKLGEPGGADLGHEGQTLRQIAGVTRAHFVLGVDAPAPREVELDQHDKRAGEWKDLVVEDGVPCGRFDAAADERPHIVDCNQAADGGHHIAQEEWDARRRPRTRRRR